MTNQEIEKRFLVTELSPNFFGLAILNNARPINIKQGYIELASSVKSFRVRTMDETRVEQTVKSGQGVYSVENQYFKSELDLARFLIDNLVDHELEKTRYKISGWEINFFKPPLEGIVLAEKEFQSLNEIPPNLELPLWIGRGVDITDSLTNHHLARLATLLKSTNAKAIEVILNYHLIANDPGGWNEKEKQILKIIDKLISRDS